jgi:hypothetical protein
MIIKLGPAAAPTRRLASVPARPGARDALSAVEYRQCAGQLVVSTRMVDASGRGFKFAKGLESLWWHKLQPSIYSAQSIQRLEVFVSISSARGITMQVPGTWRTVRHVICAHGTT